MDARRIALIDLNGSIVGMIDVSKLDHANSQTPMTLAVQTRCDMGDWHTGQEMELVPWGRAVKDPYPPPGSRRA
jgi:hypothetical protein